MRVPVDDEHADEDREHAEHVDDVEDAEGVESFERASLKDLEPFRRRLRAVRHHLPAKAEHDVDDVGEHRQKRGQPCDDVEATRTSERSGRGGHEIYPTAR